MMAGAIVDIDAANLKHAVSFLQGAYTIVLALALSEAFKQFVADSGDRNIFWNRSYSLIGFLFQIFPFFHGMSRYLFKTYLMPTSSPESFAGYLMFDGIAFMLMSGCFFVMSRSLSPDRWQRYYGSLAVLLVVDSIWIGVALWRGVDVGTWLVLNIILGFIMAGAYLWYYRREESLVPPAIYAVANCGTTIASYYLMRDFYFSL